MDVTVEYRGQIVDAYIVRSWWRWHRVMLPVKGGYYRLGWVSRRKCCDV